MSLENEVRLVGHLGANPELFTAESGKKILKVSLATNETFKNDKGEKVTQTEWHNLVMFGKRAEVVAKYLNKGSHLAVDGKLKTRRYVDKAGIEKYVTEIIVNDALFLDKQSS